MGSDNPTGADNQQETAKQKLELDPQWVVGFVDGEGCFSVSIHEHPGVRSFGWQINPVFQVSQHKHASYALHALAGFFGCGRVRSKGSQSAVSIYAVDRRGDLQRTVIPFFRRHPLIVKQSDFELFAEVTSVLNQRLHFTTTGFERAVTLAYAMNARGKQRKRPIETVLAGSSETARQAALRWALKIQSDPHGDMGSEAEMISPSPFVSQRRE
jgi:hypothetical protein